MKKTLKIFISLCLATVLLFSFIVCANAEEKTREYDEGTYYGFELGTVLIESKRPGIQIYLDKFNHEIEETRLLTPGADWYCYSVKFKEKSREIVNEAIEFFSQFEDIISVEKNHYWRPSVMPKDPVLYNFLNDIMGAQRIPQEEKKEFEPGKVMVTMYKGSRSPEGLIENYDVESVDLISDGTGPMDVYLINFKEKTKDIYHKVFPDIMCCGYVLHCNTIFEGLDEVVKNYGVHLSKTAIKDPVVIESIFGDADKDGNVSIIDAACIQKYKVNLIDENSIDLNNADFDKDGDITILDASKLQKDIAHIYN